MNRMMSAVVVAAVLLVLGAPGLARAKTGAAPLASGVPTTGATIGPDGALYAGVSGNGDTEIVLPPAMAAEFGVDKLFFGLKSSVMRIDPTTGAVTTFATGLPSASLTAGGESGGLGPADVTFMGGRLYALISGGANYAGGAAAAYPNGIYRHNDNGTWTVVVDLSKFNDDHPVSFPDAVLGGNPFSLSVRGQEFIVSDGNYNRLLRATLDGKVTILSTFDNIVPTGTDTAATGPVYVTWFSPFPHTPGTSKLQQIGFPTGAATELASGTQLIDVKVGTGGRIYVLSMGDPAAPEGQGLPATPGTGKLMLLDGGTLKTLVDGLTVPTSLSLSGDTAFIASLIGDVSKVSNVSTLAPLPAAEPTTAVPAAPAPAPTAGSGASGVITAPNTGSGPQQAQGRSYATAMLIGLVGMAAAAAGASRIRRRSR